MEVNQQANQHAAAAFQPPRVSGVKKFTDRLLKGKEDVTDVFYEPQDTFQTYQGLRVDKRLASLMHEINAAMPTAKFGKDEVHTHREIAVYRESALHCMGLIGFGQYMQNSDAYVYMVRSTRIKNSRYKKGTLMYHTMLTTSLDRAAKLASAKLIPYTPEDDAAMSMYVPNRTLRHVLDRKTNLFYDKATFGPSTIIEEFEHLVDCGVKFKTAAFQKLAEVFGDLIRDLRYERMRSTNMYYIWVNDVRGVQWATVITAMNVRQNGHIVTDGPKQLFKLDDLPHDIAAKIATLSITDHGSYVEGLGVRLDDTHFWIERDEQGEG